MPIQVAGGGTISSPPPGGDPCASYPSPGCNPNIPTADQFIALAYNPNNVRDGNGCITFNGCYVRVGTTYYQWLNFDVGYVPVGPATPAQQFGTLSAAPYVPPPPVAAPQYAPGAGAPQTPQGTLQTDSGPLTGPVTPNGHIYVGSQITIGGKLLIWGGDSQGYIVAPTPPPPASYPPVTTQIPGPVNPVELLTSGAYTPQAYQQLSQPITVNVDTAQIADVLGRAVAQNGAQLAAAIEAQKTQAPPVNVSLDTTPISDAVSRIAANQQADLAAIPDAIDRVLAAHNADLGQALSTSFGLKPEQLAAEQSGADSLKTLAGIATAFQQDPQKGIQALAKALVSGSLGGVGQQISDRMAIYTNLFQSLLHGDFKSWSDLENALNQVTAANDIGLKIIDVIAIVTIIARVGVIRAEPIVNELSQLSWADNPNRVLDQGTLQEVFKRALWNQTDTLAELAKQGIGPERGQLILATAEQLLDPATNELGYLRGFITAEDSSANLQKLGYSAESASVLAQLMQKIPPPSDLTRIADKRVWGLQTDPKYGQYAELPDEYVQFMQNWGYDEKFTNWLWASHWNLPSPQQVFTMFHRKEITRADMETYLGLTDWLPFFRDGLLAISYDTLGRIDIKRAHNAGILDDQTAQTKYEALGYSPEDATILVRLSKQTGSDFADHILETLRKRAQSAVERAYVKGTIDAQTALSHLQALGIEAPDAYAVLSILDHEVAVSGSEGLHAAHTKKAIDLIIRKFAQGGLPYDDALSMLGQLQVSRDDAVNELLYAEMDRLAELKGELANHAIKLYAERIIDFPTFQATLANQDFSGTEISQLAQEAEMKRQERTKHLTEAELKTLHKKGIINDAEYVNELKGLGYPDKYVAWLAQL